MRNAQLARAIDTSEHAARIARAERTDTQSRQLVIGARSMIDGGDYDTPERFGTGWAHLVTAVEGERFIDDLIKPDRPDFALRIAGGIDDAHDEAGDKDRARFGEPGDELPVREPDWVGPAVPVNDDPSEHDSNGNG